ncbi:uncharacterized protein LOC124931303 [Impatiens glandulifera]|uniref:uncharacterized protein LOC124931303 n=1 Tax=Impatiens glandulifera TaxID=253017 RepID=UPI001FB0D47D|nr:uncharacterized protein LOC124931303 [Impatiens glandulifera]
MAHVMRPLLLLQSPRWLRRCCSPASFNHLLSNSSSSPLFGNPRLLFHIFRSVPSSYQSVHFQRRIPKLKDRLAESDLPDTDGEESDSQGLTRQSRNEKKRDARLAVQWGRDIAAFSIPEIKLILRAASLEQEVFDAIMVAKRLGRDVKEGKRRQFNYIGRLIREGEPVMMDGLIQATKDGGLSKLQAFCRKEALITVNVDNAPQVMEYEDEVKASDGCMELVERWLDGLMKRDMNITKEIYSVKEVDFDRQKLRRLVKELYSIQDLQQLDSDEGKGQLDEVAALVSAKKSLKHFLIVLAKQFPIGYLIGGEITEI